MMSLYNQEDIMRSYIKSERHDADMESARRMLKMGKIKTEDVSDCFPDLNSFEIQKLESEML